MRVQFQHHRWLLLISKFDPRYAALWPPTFRASAIALLGALRSKHVCNDLGLQILAFLDRRAFDEEDEDDYEGLSSTASAIMDESNRADEIIATM